MNLAEDIVANGMSPAHRMLVIKAPGKGSTGHVVVDGNRRLAALRVLANPSVLDGMGGVGDLPAKKLRQLAKDFDLDDIQPIDVYICKNESDARHWIEAIHTGENDGRGRIEFHQQDALAFIDEIAPKLPVKSLIYLDPPSTLRFRAIPEQAPARVIDGVLGESVEKFQTAPAWLNRRAR